MTNTDPDKPAEEKTRFRKDRFYLIVTLIALIPALCSILGYRMNLDQSLIPSLYKIKKGRLPNRGDIVAFYVPQKFVRLSISRGYSTNRSWFNRKEKLRFLKITEGVPGDQVVINDRGVYVNGKYIKKSKPGKSDSVGRAMPKVELNQTLKEGEYICMSEDIKTGYDSRYFGIITSDHFIGSGKRITYFPYIDHYNRLEEGDEVINKASEGR